jgi:platelet-activating factor acetylhydrolase IB subunit alpha
MVQTVRIWNALNGESKIELLGHDHVVEIVTFAPIAAYAAIRELAGIPVGTFLPERQTVGDQ